MTSEINNVKCNAKHINSIKSIKFNSLTKEVFDDSNKFLGHGELVDSMIKIKKPQVKT